MTNRVLHLRTLTALLITALQMAMSFPLAQDSKGVLVAAETAGATSDDTHSRMRERAIQRLQGLGLLKLDTGEVLLSSRVQIDLERSIREFQGRYDGKVLQETLRWLPELERLALELSAGQSLDAAGHISQLKRLRELRIAGPRFDEDRVLAADNRSPDKNSPDITDTQIRYLGKIHSLESLCISNCRLTDEEFSLLANMPSLRDVNLSRTDITVDVFRTIAKYPRITRVAIYYHVFDQPIEPRTSKAIASLNGRLKELAFGEWGETKVHPSVLSAVGQIHSLRHLELGDISHMQPEDLTPLRNLKSLTHLQASVEPNTPIALAYAELQQEVAARSAASHK